MKKIIITILAIASFVQVSYAQDKVASQLYNNKGKKVKYKKMIKDLAESDMVFFGEYHTNPISHWMQLEMTMSFFELKGDKLFFGAEMFESGNQLVMDEYLAGMYAEKKMLPEITQMWGNYQTDYKPLVEFAKENNLRFIASNIPRRYASMINKKGMDAL
ncbi:MAG: ChaN family lipoprotein, partial [Urechidicola sp.]|nr:ChaN family lipoprotein [Urechidicola sp.]